MQHRELSGSTLSIASLPDWCGYTRTDYLARLGCPNDAPTMCRRIHYLKHGIRSPKTPMVAYTPQRWYFDDKFTGNLYTTLSHVGSALTTCCSHQVCKDLVSSSQFRYTMLYSTYYISKINTKLPTLDIRLRCVQYRKTIMVASSCRLLDTVS